MKTAEEKLIDELIEQDVELLRNSPEMKDVESAIAEYSAESARYQEFRDEAKNGIYNHERVKSMVACFCRRQAILHIIHGMQKQNRINAAVRREAEERQKAEAGR